MQKAQQHLEKSSLSSENTSSPDCFCSQATGVARKRINKTSLDPDSSSQESEPLDFETQTYGRQMDELIKALQECATNKCPNFNTFCKVSFGVFLFSIFIILELKACIVTKSIIPIAVYPLAVFLILKIWRYHENLYTQQLINGAEDYNESLTHNLYVVYKRLMGNKWFVGLLLTILFALFASHIGYGPDSTNRVYRQYDHERTKSSEYFQNPSTNPSLRSTIKQDINSHNVYTHDHFKNDRDDSKPIPRCPNTNNLGRKCWDEDCTREFSKGCHSSQHANTKTRKEGCLKLDDGKIFCGESIEVDHAEFSSKKQKRTTQRKFDSRIPERLGQPPAVYSIEYELDTRYSSNRNKVDGSYRMVF